MERHGAVPPRLLTPGPLEPVIVEYTRTSRVNLLSPLTHVSVSPSRLTVRKEKEGEKGEMSCKRHVYEITTSEKFLWMNYD